MNKNNYNKQNKINLKQGKSCRVDKNNYNKQKITLKQRKKSLEWI